MSFASRRWPCTAIHPRSLSLHGAGRLVGRVAAGAWLVKDPNAPFPQHLYVFNGEGTMQQANPDAGDPRTSDSDGKGTWVVAGNRIKGRWVELLADCATQRYASRLEVSYELDVNGDGYMGTESVRVFDANGNEGTAPVTGLPIEGRVFHSRGIQHR
jgi:hypothetical protein